MPITIGTYTFAGPYHLRDTNYLGDTSGVYAILCGNRNNYEMIDIEESSGIRKRVKRHEREDCWNENCTNNLYVAVHYTHRVRQAGRMQIEQELREKFQPPCGKR